MPAVGPPLLCKGEQGLQTPLDLWVLGAGSGTGYLSLKGGAARNCSGPAHTLIIRLEQACHYDNNARLGLHLVLLLRGLHTVKHSR